MSVDEEVNVRERVMEYRYRAFMLKKREVGETDRIYTFFTREAGKISALAKGVRRGEAKLASALETGSEVDLTVVRSRGMGKIAGATLENSHTSLRGNFESLQMFLATLGIFDRLVDFEDRDEFLYNLLTQYVATLELLSQGHMSEKMRLIDVAFFFQFTIHLGYALELNRCVVSEEVLRPGERYLISPSQGGVMKIQYAREHQDGLMIGQETIKALRLFTGYPLLSITKLIVNTETLTELERFRTIFLLWIRR